MAEFLSKFNKSDKQAKFCRDALLFFYTNVVPSENHCNVIKSQPLPPTVTISKPILPSVLSENAVNTHNPPPQPPNKPATNAASSIADYLKRMQTELKARNYSLRTIKNYRAAVHQYLLWIKREPSPSDVPEIIKFQVHLKDGKKYSPRTVNLVTAAILFFYKNVLGLRLPVDTLPRMKTGRPLPKVYSEQDIEKISIVKLSSIYSIA